MVNRNWFKNMKALDTTVANPDGRDTKVSKLKEVAIQVEDVNGKTKPLVLRKVLAVSGYQTNLISVSSLVDNGHKVVHEEKTSILRPKHSKKFPTTKKRNLFYLSMIPKQGNHFANLSGGSNEKWDTTLAQAIWTCKLQRLKTFSIERPRRNRWKMWTLAA